LTPHWWYFEPLPMVFCPPYAWYVEPLTRLYWPPYPWYIEPPIHGMLTPYAWYVDPPNRGILTPLPMIFLPPYPWYIDSPHMVYQTLSFGRNKRGQFTIRGSKYNDEKSTPGSIYHMLISVHLVKRFTRKVFFLIDQSETRIVCCGLVC
jgi:hypothetical protein